MASELSILDMQIFTSYYSISTQGVYLTHTIYVYLWLGHLLVRIMLYLRLEMRLLITYYMLYIIRIWIYIFNIIIWEVITNQLAQKRLFTRRIRGDRRMENKKNPFRIYTLTYSVPYKLELKESFRPSLIFIMFILVFKNKLIVYLILINHLSFGYFLQKKKYIYI